MQRAMETGAAGFLLKDAPPEQLALAIRRTAKGECVMDPGLAAVSLSEASVHAIEALAGVVVASWCAFLGAILLAIAGTGSIVALFSTTLLEIAVAGLLLGAVAATLWLARTNTVLA